MRLVGEVQTGSQAQVRFVTDLRKTFVRNTFRLAATSADLLPLKVQEQYRQSRLVPSAKFMYEWFELVDLQDPPMLDLYAELKASGYYT